MLGFHPHIWGFTQVMRFGALGPIWGPFGALGPIWDLFGTLLGPWDPFGGPCWPLLGLFEANRVT